MCVPHSCTPLSYFFLHNCFVNLNLPFFFFLNSSDRKWLKEKDDHTCYTMHIRFFVSCRGQLVIQLCKKNWFFSKLEKMFWLRKWFPSEERIYSKKINYLLFLGVCVWYFSIKAYNGWAIRKSFRDTVATVFNHRENGVIFMIKLPWSEKRTYNYVRVVFFFLFFTSFLFFLF